jgi:hypothetical protein
VNTADSIWAFELGHRAAEIAERLAVPRVRFAPGPLAEQAARGPRAEPPRPTKEHERAARDIAAGIADENLRESMQKAVSLSLARRPSDSEV